MSDVSSVRSFNSLLRFVRERPAAERCELCSKDLAAGHQHLLEPATRKLLCACEACAVLFSGQAGTKYRRVPRRIRFLTDFRMSDGQWDALLVPINMAFSFTAVLSKKSVRWSRSVGRDSASRVGLTC